MSWIYLPTSFAKLIGTSTVILIEAILSNSSLCFSTKILSSGGSGASVIWSNEVIIESKAFSLIETLSDSFV